MVLKKDDTIFHENVSDAFHGRFLTRLLGFMNIFNPHLKVTCIKMILAFYGKFDVTIRGGGGVGHILPIFEFSSDFP